MHRIHRSGIAIALVAAMVGSDGAAHAQTDEACIAANERAVTLRKSGRLLDTRKELSFCAAATCPDPVKSSCQKRLEQLNSELPSVLFDVKDAGGNVLTDVRLMIDGAPYNGMIATAITLDPGDHEFKLEVAGQEPVMKHFVLRKSEKDRRETIVIGKLASSEKATTEKSSTSASTSPTPDSSTSTSGSHGIGLQRTLAIVAGSAGLVAVGVGVYLRGSGKSQYDEAVARCTLPGPYPCSQANANDAVAGRDRKTLGWIVVGSGGALVVGGIVLWLTRPSGEGSAKVQVSPWVAAGLSGIQFQGRF